MGTKGVGLIGLFNSAIGMLKTGTGLGISQSAVRDISEANGEKNIKQFSKAIVTTNFVIVFTSLFGLIFTVAISPLLSKWVFDDYSHALSFVLLSLAVAFTILNEGKMAILKGMRRLRILAKSNILGAIAGLILSVPIYIIYKVEGIVPVLIVIPFVSFLFSFYFVKKIEYQHLKLSYKEIFKNSWPMIKMGVALSFATFLGHISVFIISAFIGSSEGGLNDLGLYNAGVMIMVGYFSVIINALTTDYYPRISAVNKYNDKLQEELNQQSIVSLLISFPLIVFFLFLLPVIIPILYSGEFLPIIDFVRIGIYGTLITICSNQLDLILIAKNNTKTYTIISIIFRSLEVAISICLYTLYGLIGMGIAFLLIAVLHMGIMVIAVNKLYRIKFNLLFVKTSGIVLLFTLMASFLSSLDFIVLRYLIGGILPLCACGFSYYYSKKVLNFNILSILSNKENKK